jgi:glucosyl-dolichyl phosphate glucuronosyltransferase
MNTSSIPPKYEITVSITRYSETDSIVEQCLTSLGKQKRVKANVLFLDQKESKYIKYLVENFKSDSIGIEYINIATKSLSYARNLGIKNSSTRYVAFCDSDCILNENWLDEILNVFKNNHAAIVGTKILPKWEGKLRWFNKSKIANEFYSLIDISESLCEIPKVVGASFAIDKLLIKEDAYFDENLGRRPGKFLGGEETDLCQRIKERNLKVFYTPNTFAYHIISRERTTWSWFIKRSYFGGYSRALRGGKTEPFNKKRDTLDKLVTVSILPFYMLGYFKGKLENVQI